MYLASLSSFMGLLRHLVAPELWRLCKVLPKPAEHLLVDPASLVGIRLFSAIPCADGDGFAWVIDGLQKVIEAIPWLFTHHARNFLAVVEGSRCFAIGEVHPEVGHA